MSGMKKSGHSVQNEQSEQSANSANSANTEEWITHQPRGVWSSTGRRVSNLPTVTPTTHVPVPVKRSIDHVENEEEKGPKNCQKNVQQKMSRNVQQLFQPNCRT